jgi:hypothetical protein
MRLFNSIRHWVPASRSWFVSRVIILIEVRLVLDCKVILIDLRVIMQRLLFISDLTKLCLFITIATKYFVSQTQRQKRVEVQWKDPVPIRRTLWDCVCGRPIYSLVLIHLLLQWNLNSLAIFSLGRHIACILTFLENSCLGECIHFKDWYNYNN